MKSDLILQELLKKQRKQVPLEKKLRYNDLKRLCKYINGHIFDENECVIWNGYITNANKFNKGLYINFYFKGKKTALHRLLYINFIDDLDDNEYLKFSCENKGKCCNIFHLQKFEYNLDKSKVDTENIKSLHKKKKRKPQRLLNIDTQPSFKLSFE